MSSITTLPFQRPPCASDRPCSYAFGWAIWVNERDPIVLLPKDPPPPPPQQLPSLVDATARWMFSDRRPHLPISAVIYYHAKVSRPVRLISPNGEGESGHLRHQKDQQNKEPNDDASTYY